MYVDQSISKQKGKIYTKEKKGVRPQIEKLVDKVSGNVW